MKSYTIDLQYAQDDNLPPTHVVLTGRQGRVTTYVPEADCPPEPKFKVGDIVKIIGSGLGHKGRRGIVTEIISQPLFQDFCIRVSFGDETRTYQVKSLEAA